MSTYYVDAKRPQSVTSLGRGDIMYLYADGTLSTLTVNEDATLYAYGEITALTVNDSAIAHIYAGGSVNAVTLCEAGWLTVEAGATALGITQESNGKLSVTVDAETSVKGSNSSGTFSVQKGVATNFIVYDGSTLTVTNDCSATTVSLRSGGHLYLQSGSSASGITQYQNGAISATVSAKNDSVVTGKTAAGEDFSLRSGTASNFQLYKNSLLTVKSDGSAQNCTIYSGGTMRLTQAGASARNTVVSRGGVIEVKVAGTTLENTTVGGNISLAGATDANGTDFIFDLSARKSSDGYILNHLAYLQNAELAVSVTAQQAAGRYLLAADAAAFSGTLTLSVGGEKVSGTIGLSSELLHQGKSYTLVLADDVLALDIAVSPIPEILTAKAGGVTWTAAADAESYQLEISQSSKFSSALVIETSALGADLFNMPSDTYFVRSRVAGDSEVSAIRKFTAAQSDTPGIVKSEANQTPDLFFARSSGKWDEKYQAEHNGSLEQKGNKEVVALDGKNRFRDVFQGSADQNILCLTDDSCGDALFFDDIYSENGDAGRLLQIDEIRAGKGDDIIDFTSARYEGSADKMIVRGGDGNDVIWANSGTNLLCGDAGNDRIIGGSGDDWIAGGTGNDTLSGNGGNDVFAFGGDWGDDTVYQRTGAGNTLTLWFAKGEEISVKEKNGDVIFTGNGGTVTVKDRSADEIVYHIGTSGGTKLYAEYALAGAFKASSSHAVWEQLA